MTRPMLLWGALALAGLSGPAGARRAPPPQIADWKRVVTPEDMTRLRNWRVAFVKALDAARIGGNAAAVQHEGVLLIPDAALPGPELPSGRYRCRVVKLGANDPTMPGFTAYPAFDCQVADEGEVSSFMKVGGSQRPVGLIFSGDGAKQIFLGTMMLGDETRALDYGHDRARDMAGAIERIGPKRWRLILPYPRFESIMDVVELVPAA